MIGLCCTIISEFMVKYEIMKIRKITQVQFIVLGFFLMIILGTFLLMLPVSSRDMQWTPFLDAAFTATSASCVTGLVVYDTFTHWSLFGQLVIITLIQIGGLGFVTIGLFFSIFMRRKIGLGARNLMQESISALRLSGMVRMSKRIVMGTFIIEGTGAVLLSLRFIPRMGFATGIYYGIYHSISAFCNAGFDLMGKYEEYSSFTAYADDVLVNIVLIGLILIGGLGFMVWEDLYHNKLNFKKYTLHTKLVIVGTVIFTILGAVLFYIIEYDELFAGLSPVGKIMAALFSSVTPRTAGFNTVDTGALSDESQLLSLILMIIGGNSGSTAGGAKVTTIMVLILFIIASLRQSSQVEIFGRRLTDDVIRKAAVVFSLNLILAITATMFICSTSVIKLEDALFETFSAINTVGMTRNLTRDLSTASRIMIMLLMYFGRIGSMTFAFSFLRKRDTNIIKSPVEEISVG